MWQRPCDDLISGFKVVLHRPDELPNFEKRTFYVQDGEEVFLLIKPDMVIASDGLRSYKPHQKHCFSESEQKLRFFRTYTQYHCELECLSNFSKIECGCLAFFMPSMNIV